MLIKPINSVVDQSLRKKKVVSFSRDPYRFFVGDELLPSASIGVIPIVGGGVKEMVALRCI